MNGCPSPTTRHCPTSGCARSRSSSTAGATFLPPAVTMISFLRPVMRRKPASSSSPMSPVRNQPSVERLGGGVRVVAVAAEHDGAADEDLAVVGDPHRLPGQGPPDGADPLRGEGVDRDRRGGLGQAVALQHREARCRGRSARGAPSSGALPDTAARTCPPSAARSSAVDQRVEQRVPQPQRDAGAAGVAAPRSTRRRWRPRRRRSCPCPRRGPGAARRGRPSRTRAARRAGPSAGTRARSSSRCLASGEWPSTVRVLERRALDDLAEHVRERQEQQDRAARRRAARAGSSRPCAPRLTRLRWVSSQPFGRPVVPEV